ncbi:MAG: hypothetical protein AB7O43_21165 [Hyphomicrobiaceae bacterium]
MKAGSRHSPPIWVPHVGASAPLTRHHLGVSTIDTGQRERFIQELIHRHPEVIPMADIEPAYACLIPVCTELNTSAGFLDNFWITPDGGLVLGECKLFRNAQARREVVAQGLDYARALMGWSYENLENAVQIALKQPSATLWGLVEGLSDLEEVQFVDAVERRLRAGRLMVLIIGDGIQEGAEALTAFLQLHAGIHAGLALVDLSVWHGMDGGLLVVPRVPMRTTLVPRGIVTIDHAGVLSIKAPDTSAEGSPSERGLTLSEAEFYDQLQKKRPDLVAPLQEFVSSLADLTIVPDYRKSLVLRWWPTPDVRASMGYIDTTGTVWLGDAYGSAARLGFPAAGERYLATLAEGIGGSVRRYEKHVPQIMGPNGKGADAGALIKARGLWKDAMSQLVKETHPEGD